MVKKISGHSVKNDHSLITLIFGLIGENCLYIKISRFFELWVIKSRTFNANSMWEFSAKTTRQLACNTAQAAAVVFVHWGLELVGHSQCCPLLSFCNFDLILKMKKTICGIRLNATSEILHSVDQLHSKYQQSKVFQK